MNNWATSVRLTQILEHKEHRDHHLVNCVVSFFRPSNIDHGEPAKQRICIFPGRVFSSNIWNQGLRIVQWKKLDMLKRWRSTDHLSISTGIYQASPVSTGLLSLHPKQVKKSRMTYTVRAPEISRTHLLFSSPCATVLHFTILDPTALNRQGLVPECIYLVSTDQTRKEHVGHCQFPLKLKHGTCPPPLAQ